MDAPDGNERARLADLERRVADLERAIRITPSPGRSSLHPPLEKTPQPRPSERTPAATGAGARAPSAPGPAPFTTPLRAPAPRRLPQFLHRAADARESDASSLTLERWIGARLFAVVGALVVVAAAALFLKLAWDEGWMDLLPNAWKCALSAAFGSMLVVAGELVRKRFGAAASIGCSAAGLGVVYAAAYAAYGLYQLVPNSLGFAMLAATTALGVLVGLRARLASIVALAIVAGYGALALYSDALPPPAVPAAYLLSLLGVGLLLSAALGGAFTRLRSLVWWGTTVLGGAWLLLDGIDHLTVSVAFVALAWLGIHAELTWSARRRSLASGDAQPAPRLDRWRTVRPLASSLGATAWAVAGAAVALRHHAIEEWFSPAIGLGASALAALVQSRDSGLLRRSPRSDTERLAAVLAVQTGALALVSVALALAGWMEVAAWLALGLAAVVMGRWLKSRPLDAYGLIALALATARMIVLEWWNPDLADGGAAWRGVWLTRFAATVEGAAAAWLISGALLRASAPARTVWRAAAHACIGLGVTLAFAAGYHERTTPTGAVWLTLAMGTVSILLARPLASPGLAIHSAVVQVVVGAMLIAQQWWTPRADPHATLIGGLVFTRWTPWLLAGAAAWFLTGATLLSPRLTAWPGAGAFAAGAGVGALLAACLHESASSQSTAWAWIVVAVGVHLAAPLAPRLELRLWSLLAALASVAPWAVAHMQGWAESAAAPLGHPGLVQGVAIGALTLAMAVRAGRAAPAESEHRRAAAAVAAAAVALLLVATSMEVARVAALLTSDLSSRRAAVSIWWGLFAVGLLLAGFGRRLAPVRHAGLGLLAAATIKAVAFDLTGVAPAWRVVSFFVLGVLMLGVGLLYARVHARLSRAEPRTPTDSDRAE